MEAINFNNNTFSLIENSEKGTVNSSTIFLFKQEGELVTADYQGGTIDYGKISAIYKNSRFDMRYQCLATENLLKEGNTDAEVSLTELGKVKLQQKWQWLNEKIESGFSEYPEI